MILLLEAASLCCSIFSFRSVNHALLTSISRPSFNCFKIFIIQNRHYEDRGRWWTFYRKSETLRWTLTLVTGFCCGLVALFVAFFTRMLTRFKFETFSALVLKEKNNELPFGSAFAFLLGINLVFGCVAWLMVYLEPLANGSGNYCSTTSCYCLYRLFCIPYTPSITLLSSNEAAAF